MCSTVENPSSSLSSSSLETTRPLAGDFVDRPPSLIPPFPSPPVDVVKTEIKKADPDKYNEFRKTDDVDHGKFMMRDIYESFNEEVDKTPFAFTANHASRAPRPQNTPAYSERRKFYNTQLKSLKTDSEGITTRHTTYLPPSPSTKILTTKKQFNIKDIFSDSHLESTTEMPGLYSNDYYPMSSFPRGVLTLINMKDFSKQSKNQNRDGTDIDAVALTTLFLDLGFVVERYDNPSTDEILAITKVNAALDYTNKSCCACAVLSHGDDGFISSKDGEVSIKDIVEPFKASGLAGIPKLFIFQACRGSVYMKTYDSVDGRPNENTQYTLTLPREADFLFAYSTVPGYYSWRNSLHGSWFIEALVHVFRTHAHKMDVLRMLVKVNNQVSNRFPNVKDEEINKTKQIPSFVCQLRKDLFLFPPNGPVY